MLKKKTVLNCQLLNTSASTVYVRHNSIGTKLEYILFTEYTLTLDLLKLLVRRLQLKKFYLGKK